jgi:exodeoxyribonuclease V alpha subunit
VDTREQVSELNAAIRSRLVADGRVDDTHVVTTRTGQRIGAGDRIATRRNDRYLGVANRDTWTVTAVGRRGGLLVTSSTTAGDASGNVTPAGSEVRVLPADYVAEQVELAYASTVHGVQGDTVTAAHVVLGHQTGAASAYVGMTRGRASNTAHLIAADLAEARAQWIAAFGRDRADLGPRDGGRPSPVVAPRQASVDEQGCLHGPTAGSDNSRRRTTGEILQPLVVSCHQCSQRTPSPGTEHSPPDSTGASHVRPPRPP